MHGKIVITKNVMHGKIGKELIATRANTPEQEEHDHCKKQKELIAERANTHGSMHEKLPQGGPVQEGKVLKEPLAQLL